MQDLNFKLCKMAALVAGKAPDIYHIDVRHDDGCPAIRTGAMRDCICEPEMQVYQDRVMDALRRFEKSRKTGRGRRS